MPPPGGGLATLAQALLATLDDRTGCPDDNDVLAFVEGELEPDARDTIEAHVASCALCRRLMHAYGADPLVPRKLGRYAIRRRLGQGGMGVVYAAHDPQLDREIAVKALHAGGSRSAKRNAMLAREAAAMAKLNHPNTVKVFDVGATGDQMFVAMELVDGASLRDRMRQGPVPWPVARRILLDVAAGVAAAHRAGIVHRDLKPGNVLLHADGRALVTDFGLAGWDDHDQATTLTEPARSDDDRPTFRAAGTPIYMAPEQHRGEPSDVRTDVFAFCAMAYELLFGTVPFRGTNPGALLLAKEEGELQPPRETDAPAWVRGVLVRGLAADRGERWPSMLRLRLALGRRPRRRAIWIAAPVLAGIGLFAASDLGNTPDCGAADDLRASWQAARTELPWHFEHLDATARDHARRVAERRIDEYVAHWADACEDTGLDRRARRDRHACLAAGRAALESLFASLRERDPELVYRIDAAAQALPSLDTCDESVPAEAFEQAVAIRRALAQSVTLMHLGRYEESAAALDGLEDAAREADAAWLEANVFLQRARLALNRGLAAEVVPAAEAAHTLAAEHGLAEAEGGAAVQLCLAAATLGNHEEAQRWLRTATAAYERVPELSSRRADLHRAALRVAQLSQDFDAALEHGKKAVAAAEAEGGPTSWRIVEPLNDLANIYLLKHDTDGARQRVERGLQLVEQSYGLSHPQAGMLRATMANVELRAGNLEAAVEHLRAADAVFARTTAPTEGFRLTILTNLGNLELARGNWAEGRAALIPLLDHLKATYGESGEGYLGALNNVAAADLELKDLEAARTRFSEVLRLRSARDGKTTAAVAEAIMHVGLVDLAEEDYDAAQRKLEEARDLYIKAAGPDHPPIAAALKALGRIALARGNKKHAAALARRGLALRKDPELELLLQLAEE